MEIDFNDFRRTIQDFIQVGYMQAIKTYEPTHDRVRQSEIKQWLKLNLIDGKTFNKMVKAGIIKPFRIGRSLNSPLYFSKEEIKKAIAMHRAHQAIIISNH